MTRVAFVFTNPRHHFEMMLPVARALRSRGVDCELVSLAELRGYDSPAALPDVPLRRVIPINVRRRSSIGSTWSDTGSKRRLAQRVAWFGLRARLWSILRSVDAIVVPNDAVFPYQDLISWLGERDVPYILMQEGIRFSLPNTYQGAPYGAGGGTVCAWGQGSAEHFIATGTSPQNIDVTGSPRLDSLVPSEWTERGAALRAKLGLRSAPIAFLSNPIEIQGYGTRQHKLDLFAQFLDNVAPMLEAHSVPLLVKTHAFEDPVEFARIAKRTKAAANVHVTHDAALYATIAASRAAIVLASTVGLEALIFGLPLGVLEIPGHEPPFEYVQRGAAAAIRQDSVATSCASLLQANDATRAAGMALVTRHLHDLGRASHNVADVVQRVIASRAHRAA